MIFSYYFDLYQEFVFDLNFVYFIFANFDFLSFQKIQFELYIISKVFFKCLNLFLFYAFLSKYQFLELDSIFKLALDYLEFQFVNFDFGYFRFTDHNQSQNFQIFK